MRSGTRMQAAVLIAMAAVVAQGCASVREHVAATVGGPGVRACAQYMLVGAATGAELGAATGNNRRQRVRNGATGATLGAAAGYAVCTQVWRQKQELEAEFAALDADAPAPGGAEPEDRVVRAVEVVDENSALRLDLNLRFATGQARLEPRVTSHLRVIAANLLARPNSTIRIVGHTDSSGDPGRNRALSRSRADSVAAYLATQGVDRARLQTEGVGSDQPRGDDRDPAGRALNRRVELFIYPHT